TERLMELIAGDIGGTKSWLVWMRDGAVTPRFEKVYSSADFASGEALLARFIEEAGQSAHPDTLTLALPGPLAARRVSLTNLDWTLDADALGSALDLPRVQFVNDFQAQAAGVATLGADDVLTLNAAPAVPSGVRAITGAGTGLGLAFMTAGDDGQYLSHATEAGHADFAPANALQGRLLDHLRQRYGHVSREMGISLNGLCAVWEALSLIDGVPVPQAEAVQVVAQARAGDRRAREAVGMVTDWLAAMASDIALIMGARGGIYLTGALLDLLDDLFDAERFCRGYVNKGGLTEYVSEIPVFRTTARQMEITGLATLF
ncbi:MAG: hypothetical protein B7Z26_02370, partial [Asticcacaulis sp. 32-58-5]